MFGVIVVTASAALIVALFLEYILSTLRPFFPICKLILKNPYFFICYNHIAGSIITSWEKIILARLVKIYANLSRKNRAAECEYKYSRRLSLTYVIEVAFSTAKNYQVGSLRNPSYISDASNAAVALP